MSAGWAVLGGVLGAGTVVALGLLSTKRDLERRAATVAVLLERSGDAAQLALELEGQTLRDALAEQARLEVERLVQAEALAFMERDYHFDAATLQRLQRL